MSRIHTTKKGSGAVLLTPPKSSLFLAWLASHRNRLRVAAVGTRRFSFVFIWDTDGSKSVHRSPEDLAAIYQITYGNPSPPSIVDD